MKIFDKQIGSEYERAKNTNSIDYQMLLQDIKTREKIEKQRKEVLNNQKVKKENWLRKVEQNRQLCEEQQKEKIIELKQSREVKEAYVHNKKTQKIIPKSYITHMEKIEETNEELRNRINNEITSKMQLYSTKHDNHIEQIKSKSYIYNKSVINKHDQYWEERKIDNNDKQIEIDMVNAKKYHCYQRYMLDRRRQAEHYHNQLEQKALMALNNRHEMNSSKDEDLNKMVKRIREESSMDITPRRGNSNKNDKTTKQKFDERQLMMQKQYENKVRLDNEKIIKNEKILLEEYDLFKRVNDEEFKKESERQKNQINTIFIQEKKDRIINDLTQKINKLKNDSIYKKNLSNLNQEL